MGNGQTSLVTRTGRIQPPDNCPAQEVTAAGGTVSDLWEKAGFQGLGGTKIWFWHSMGVLGTDNKAKVQAHRLSVR